MAERGKQGWMEGESVPILTIEMYLFCLAQGHTYMVNTCRKTNR